MYYKILCLGLVVCFGLGCAGPRWAKIDSQNPEKFKYSGGNLKLLGPPEPGPIAMAEAYYIKRQADNLSRNVVARARSEYSFGAVNLSSREAWVWDPEFGRFRHLNANGGRKILHLSFIPERLHFKNHRGHITWKPRVPERKMHTKKILAGHQVDLIFQLERQ